MGQQQLLLLILGVIIVGIAIAVGVSQFSAQSSQANKDGVTSNLVNIAANAYQFRIRPTTMGGGGNSYISYAIPSKMASDANGTYTLGTVASNSIQIIGTSTVKTTWVATCTSNDTGYTTFVYNGW
jgi:type II secretory pathway pseudopilin PulG